MSKTLINLALSASLLASPGFTAAAAETDVGPTVTLKIDQPVPPEMLTIRVTPQLAPLTVKVETNLFGKLTERFAFCSTIKQWADVNRNMTADQRAGLRGIMLDGINDEIATGRIKFDAPVRNTPTQNAEALIAMKDNAAAALVEESYKAGVEANRICGPHYTDPASPWYRKPS